VQFSQTITIAGLDLYPLAATGISPQMAIGTMPSRPALLLKVRDSDGCYGWGEVWANFPPRANIHKIHIIEDVITPVLNGAGFVAPVEIQQLLRQKLGIYFLHVGQQQVFEHILAGIDMALWDLALRKQGVTVTDFFALPQNTAPCYASSINADDLDVYIPQAVDRGQRHYKLKIGFQADAGLSLVERASALCPPGTHLMIDSNQSWNLEQAMHSLQVLQQYAPYFAEEPIAANAPPAQWEQLAKSTTIPLAGGENLYGTDQFLQMANCGMSVLQPDVAKWGGVSGALELANAIPDGVRLWPHFMGTALGQFASLALTAIIGGVTVSEAVCEIDVNENPLRTALCGDVLSISNGRVKLYSECGLVPEPLPAQLQQCRVLTG
jgi:L-alanine-DL-glutamate epimerase-like enolase superfamily enzyme